MGKIVERPETGKLFFDFRYAGMRCREQTTLDNTPANRKKLETILKRLEAEITLGSFEYHKYFPNSSLAQKFTKQAEVQKAKEAHDTPLFKEFSHITKKDILEFRASLAKVTTRSKKGLSASRINKIMTPLRMILSEAANRYEFSSPFHGIKSLKVPRTDVEL